MVLSPVGTSIFTKAPFPAAVNLYSGKKRPEDIPPEELRKIDDHVSEVRDMVLTGGLDDIRRRSAELNGIIQFYRGNLASAKVDTHILLPSDTYVGTRSCEIVAEYLHRYMEDVRVLQVKDLQTTDCAAFQLALGDLVTEIIALRQSLLHDQKLIFNLTGGFKAILGFLQSLGMFFADETIYVFEFSDSLLRLPALPVRLVPHDFVVEHLGVIRRLHSGLRVETGKCAGIPESLVLELFDEPTLSAYGRFVWESVHSEIYQKKLQVSPSALVRYSDRFLTSTEGLSPDRLLILNKRIDDLAKYAELGAKYNLPSLDFKKLRTAVKHPSTHEFDAWADGNASRVYCHYEGRVIVLDDLAEGLH